MTRWLVILAMLLPTVAWGQTQTLNPIPVGDSSFLPTLQTFLRDEDAQRYALMFSSMTASGGTHGTAAGLTGTPSPWVGFPSGYVATENGSIIYPDASTCWVIGSALTTGNISTFTRVTGTHYLLDCVSGSLAVPAGTTPLMKVVTSGGAITAVTDIRVRSPLDNAVLSGLDIFAPGATYPSFTLAADWYPGVLSILRGSNAAPMTNEKPTLLVAGTGVASTPSFGHGGTSALVASMRSTGTAVTGAIYAGDFYMEGGATGSAATMFQGALHSTTISMADGAPVWGAWFQAKMNNKDSGAAGVEINTNCDFAGRVYLGVGTTNCVGMQVVNYGASLPADSVSNGADKDTGYYSVGYGRAFVAASSHFVPTVEVLGSTGRASFGSDLSGSSTTQLFANAGSRNANDQLWVLGTGTSGVNIKLEGNNSGGAPSKFLRVLSSNFEIVNNAYSTVILQLTNAGALNIAGAYSSGGTAGITITKSVRKGDDSAACNLVFTGGLLTSSTC